MAKQHHPKPPESKAKQPAETRRHTLETGTDLVGPVGLPLTQTGGVAANPAAALYHPGLLAAQRHSLALNIGQAQGNQYLQRMMTTQQVNKPSLQRLFEPEKRSERQIIEEALRDESGLDILSLKGNFQAATPQEKLKLIEISLTKTIVVGDSTRNQLWQSLRGDLPALAPAEKWTMMKQLISGFASNNYTAFLYRIELIYDLWKSFGSDPDTMIELLSQPEPMALWKKSDDMDVDLEDLPFVEKLIREYELDISYLTGDYLQQNLEHIQQERQRLGLQEADLDYNPFGVDEEAEQSAASSPEHTAEMQATQKAAQQAAKAQGTQQELRQIPVGYRYRTQTNLFTSFLGDHYEIAYFDPEQKPTYTPQELGKDGEKFGDWAKIKKSHDELEQVINSLGDRFPAIFAVMQSGREVGGLAQADYLEARQMVARSLAAVQENIQETFPKIGGDISVYDLEPIQAQLIQGARSRSGRTWNQPLLKWVAQRAKSEHESREFWISLGLGSLAAAAFVFASLASGGTAAFLMAGGLAAGGAQAAMSWERYLDLAQAAKTNVQSRLAIVSQKQVNAALISAILDTAFALLDVYAPAKAGVQALRGGSKVAGEMVRAGAAAGGKALEGLEALRAVGGLDSFAVDGASQLNRQAVIEQAVTAVGVEETVRQSGKSLDELIELVGANSSAGKQLNYYRNLFQERFTPQILAQKVNKIKMGQAPDLLENDRVMMQLLDQHGPVAALREGGGWQHLANQVDAYTLTGQRLYTWRQQIWQEMEQVVELERGEYVMRVTGGKGFGHGLSLEFVGEQAVENSQKARSYLAGRVGVEADEVERLLNTSITANPSASAVANTSEMTIPGWRQVDDEITGVTTPGWGQMDEVTEVTTPAGVGNKGGQTQIMDQKHLENLRKRSKDKDLDFNREPTQQARDTPADLIKQWNEEGAKHGLFMTAEELTEFCVRVFKRPIEPLQHLYFHTDWASFVQALHRHHPNFDYRNLGAFFDPATGFIHIGPQVPGKTGILHETIHRMVELTRRGTREEISSFLDEGITEWLARIHTAGKLQRGAYEVNVNFVRRLARILGDEMVTNTLVHGNVEGLWNAVMRALGGNMDRAEEFFQVLRTISNNGVGVDAAALVRAEKILEEMAAAPTR